MKKYNFKVIASLRKDLKDEEIEYITDYMNHWMDKFEIEQIDNITYCKKGKITGQDDFGNVAFFYAKLNREKKYFEKLEYHDILSKRENQIAV